MNKDNSTNSKFKTVIWRLVSAIALVLSIIAICGLYYRTTDLGIDYIGIIVGILAILVTCLVAWNIYSAIDANNSPENISDKLLRPYNCCVLRVYMFLWRYSAVLAIS